MFDTFAGEILQDFDRSILDGYWTKSEVSKPPEPSKPREAPKVHYYIMIVDEGVKFKYEFLPENYAGKPQLNVEISSAQKLLFDNNIIDLQEKDIEKLILTIHTINSLHKETAFLPIDFHKLVLTRIDLCRSYLVGEDNVPLYLQILKQKTLPNKDRAVYNNFSRHKRVKNSPFDNGVTYGNGSDISRFYGKYKQTGDALAIGYLKHEKELRGKRNIGRHFHLPEAHLTDITEALVKEILDQDLHDLGLDKENHIVKNNARKCQPKFKSEPIAVQK